MKSFMFRACMALSLMLSTAAWAEDTDLFVGVPPDQSLLAAPNVLIILDNTANWNTAFNNEMDALSSVVNGLPVDKFNLGLMLFTETSGGDKGNDGAYVRAAVRRLDADYKGKFTALVDRNNVDGGDAGLHRTNDKSNGGKASKAMWEAYEYFTGGAPHAGNRKVKSDYLGNTSGTVASKAVYGLSGNALNSKDATAYNQPAQNGCVKNFIIYISNGPAQDNTNDIKAATDALIAAGGSATSIPLSPSGSQDMVADEWARFMRNQGVGVITYTVDVDKVTSGQGPGWSALLKSMATVSDGKYFDVTSSGNAIADSLKAIFSEIQAVDSSFASVSLPASVNTEGRYLNQIFIGLFRPDGNAKPQWAGNLKQYRVAKIDNALTTADAREPVKSAIGNDGYFDECARSYWTPSSTDTYWAFNAKGACLGVENSNGSNSPDGNVVEKGGHAYLLRSSTGRTMKTCSDSNCTALANFTSSVATQSLLGAASTTERDAIVNWALGTDNKDENQNEDLTEKRPYIHGDIIHSRPVAINYGTDGSPAVVVFYGGNDGLLRAVNGNRTASVGTSPAIPAGGELWSFMPTEFYPHIKRLRDEQPLISFPGQQVDDDPLTPLPKPKHYGMDGSVTAYRDDSNTWLFAGMRRGGRAIYAFDVSNPASPVLKWKKGCPSQSTDDGCTTGMSRIGQTWSTPTVFKAAGYTASGTPKPMLIMGGGYDTVRDHDGDGDLDPPCEDNDPHTCSVTKGNRIYVLDANDGTRLKKFDTERGVIADVTLVRDSTGLVTYGYTADLGGNVYRITMGSNAPADWTMTKIAALGCSDASAACARKFMFAPSVVNEGDFIRVMLGSGDREKPITSYDTATAVDNYFFMLKDKPADSTWITSGNGACGDLTKRICMSSLLEIGADDPTQSALDSKPLGWYLRLSDSEQVVTSAVTGLGKVIFSTHTPAVQQEGVCSSLGLAKSYSISYKDASAPNGERYVLVEGGGLPPSPVIVQVILDDGTDATICISCGKNRFEVQEPFETQVLPVQPKSRVYWNIEQ